MNVTFINPFVSSILNILSTMAGTEARPGKPMLKKGHEAMGDVTGMIGMIGEKTRGSLALTFTGAAIRFITSRMLGEEQTALDETVADMVGEITNMVTGGAKRVLSEQGYSFDLAIPTTIIGKDHMIYHKTHGPIIVIPFEVDGGKFFIEVCFEEDAAA